uniref:Uncharacterized protein n=1 Tax=Caenorhabditis japonica TaxID=281687 RepID=A0A8R1ESY9_CAEJA
MHSPAVASTWCTKGMARGLKMGEGGGSEGLRRSEMNGMQ